jgi:hypothetical protein
MAGLDAPQLYSEAEFNYSSADYADFTDSKQLSKQYNNPDSFLS